MTLKRTVLPLIFCIAASAATLASAQGTPNASTSTGAANADTMAPGGAGNATPKGAGDTSASGAPSTGKAKPMKKKSAKSKPAGGNMTPAQ